MCLNRKPLAYSRLESDREFRKRLVLWPGMSPTETYRAALAHGSELDTIGDAQTPPCQRRLVWEEM